MPSIQPFGFDSLVAEWFSTSFSGPTEPQTLGWPEIRAGRDVLISAPTGSGKTLAAFLICLDDLICRSRSPEFAAETSVLYVSPLKALSNDVHKNLEVPLQGIHEIAKKHGETLQPIRVALRTGDTPAKERQALSRAHPHILVTTPESLYILLTAEKSRAMLKSVRTVIVDEIHAVADDKRGSHLALSLERLDALTGAPCQRIGLSATVSPVEQVAAFLSPRAKVINIGHRREMDLAIEVPKDELSSIASNEMWVDIYDRLTELIRANRTTLVFVNTRRLSERVAHALAERLGPAAVLPHHGSLSRSLRWEAETRLKSGELQAVVATASLELGIDIGSVDLVCQIGSPRSIAVTLQRIGRSGHWVGAKPHGRLFATTRDELIECAALVHAIRCGELDKLCIPEGALDILAQQIIAETAARDWNEDELFAMLRRAYPFRQLDRAVFESVLAMLSEGVATSRGRSGAFLHRDRVNHRLRGRRGARLAAITSGGAIPENANYNVVLEPEGKLVGTLDEDFAVESTAGDVFLLGTNSWRIKRVEAGRVRVEDAHGAPPSVPFWLGEAPGRTEELSMAVSRIRKRVHEEPDSAQEFLTTECGVDATGAQQITAYVQAGTTALGAVPSRDTVVAERFFDEGGGMQLVLHSPFGARINRAWGLALRKRFCPTFNFELQAAATDNGIVISLSDQHSFPLDIIFEFLKTTTVEDVLTQAMLPAPMFTARWRWNASRSLAILRFLGGKRVPPPLQRMRSDDLLASVFPDQVACAENLTGEIRIPDHPLVKETIANCLHEAMDLDGLKGLLDGISTGKIRTVSIDTAEASPFSHEILNANPYAYLDDAPLEERRARAVQLRRTLRTDVANGAGVLDIRAIRQIASEVWPAPRNADELHDALLTFISVPPQREWQIYFDELSSEGRAFLFTREEHHFWAATERREAITDPLATVRGWMEYLGPNTASELRQRLNFPADDVEQALAKLESEGQILRGHFTPARASQEIEWCNRRILARIHRLTLGNLRREIEPVSAAQYCRFLTHWQHLAPNTRLHGADGLLQVIRQLQGYEAPAAAWEHDVLARRIVDYEPALLDSLCLSGEVMWGRLSPHTESLRITRSAPISVFTRDSAEWLLHSRATTDALSDAARETHAALDRLGASFFGDLVRALQRPPAEIEEALWQLIAAGLVTSDGFDNLRALTDPKQRRSRKASGRWALLRSGGTAARIEALADQLLQRWGVLFRDVLARESVAPPWRELLPILRTKEAQGAIRGGRFVAGFSGEQFALPEAVDLLRATRRSEHERTELIEISTADPLNLAGIILPGPRISALLAGTLTIGPPQSSATAAAS